MLLEISPGRCPGILPTSITTWNELPRYLSGNYSTCARVRRRERSLQLLPHFDPILSINRNVTFYARLLYVAQ